MIVTRLYRCVLRATMLASCPVVALFACSSSPSAPNCPAGPHGTDISDLITLCVGKMLVTCNPVTSHEYDEHDQQCDTACGPFRGPAQDHLVSVGYEQMNACLTACAKDADCASSPSFSCYQGVCSCFQGFCSDYRQDFSPCFSTECKPTSSCMNNPSAPPGDGGSPPGCCWPANQPGPVKC